MVAAFQKTVLPSTPPPACVPARAHVVAASSAAAVYTVGRRVLACTPASAAQLLMTRTKGRRFDVAAVRGTLVGFAGVSLVDLDVAGPTFIPRVKVIDLRGGLKSVGGLWGRATGMHLTVSGAAVTTQRSAGTTLLAATVPGDDTFTGVVFDRARALRGVRVDGTVVRWRRGNVERHVDVAVPRTSIDAPEQRPSGTQPMTIRFVAPLAGRYDATVGSADLPPRSTTCATGYGSARATVPGETVVLSLKSPYGWSCGDRLSGTVNLSFGHRSDAPPKTCPFTPAPCWGTVTVGAFLVPR